jgi:hydrogenase nickel incorporation protein HypA/HybF
MLLISIGRQYGEPSFRTRSRGEARGARLGAIDVMHEFSIAASLLEIITEEACAHGGSKVKAVSLRIGTLSGVVPEALEFAFQALSEGTVAEGARLVIERAALRIVCNACGTVSMPADPFIICPLCGSADVEIKEGRELNIESMEIEDGG